MLEHLHWRWAHYHPQGSPFNLGTVLRLRTMCTSVSLQRASAHQSFLNSLCLHRTCRNALLPGTAPDTGRRTPCLSKLPRLWDMISGPFPSYLCLVCICVSPFMTELGVQCPIPGMGWAALGLCIINNAGYDVALPHNFDSPLKRLSFLLFSVHIWVSLEMTVVSHLNSCLGNLILETTKSPSEQNVVNDRGTRPAPAHVTARPFSLVSLNIILGNLVLNRNRFI